jgi:hypothetical protein
LRRVIWVQSNIDIPHFRQGKSQKLEILINEEALLLAKLLRVEIITWKPQIAIFFFYKNQNAAIMSLPKSIRKTLENNGIITKGWYKCEITFKNP